MSLEKVLKLDYVSSTVLCVHVYIVQAYAYVFVLYACVCLMWDYSLYATNTIS